MEASKAETRVGIQSSSGMDSAVMVAEVIVKAYFELCVVQLG